MSSFYISLPSNVFDIFDCNKISNYKTKLPSVNKLDESWEVGLAEIIYTKSWFNIKQEQLIAVQSLKGEITSDKETNLKAGGYDDHQELIEIINQKLIKVADIHSKRFKYSKVERYPKLKYNKYSRRISLFAGKLHGKDFIFPILGPELIDMLGLEIKKDFDLAVDVSANDSNIISSGNIKGGIEAIRSFDISAGVQSLYVYCDVLEPHFVGNSVSPLLRTVVVPNSKFGDNIQEIFQTPHYFKLSKFEFDVIEISIKDDSGEDINFKDGRVVVVLHFRQNGL